MASLNATVIYASRTLNEGLFKEHSQETLTSATAMYIHEVFKGLMFYFKGQWEGQQRHKHKKVDGEAEPA